jgi:hypothetical protein
MLMLIVAILAFSSFRGVYAYRALARSISHHRAAELQLVSELSYSDRGLRAILSQVRRQEELRRLTPATRSCASSFGSSFWTPATNCGSTSSGWTPSSERRGLVGAAAAAVPNARRLPRSGGFAAGCPAEYGRIAWVMNRVYVEALDEALSDAHGAA